MVAAPRIFVSYARSDGRELAGMLRRRLEGEHGFTLWQDLADMEGGRDWWRQITDAIDRVEYVVLLMTPAAVASRVVGQEWRYARQRGRCVVPVIGTADLDFSALPGWMRRAHFVDPAVPEQWTRFVRTLERPCVAPRVPMMAEPPPHDFVPRQHELEALRSCLLDGRAEPMPVTVALRGAGGYGKTTLARALCHDEAIEDAFHDGVLWVTLGEQPGDLAGKVEDLIVALTGAASGLSSLEMRSARLRELLADRSILLVVDDVWNRAHLEPFLVPGRRCARLVTTRNADVLPDDAREVRVEAMQSAEALALLASGLPPGGGRALRRLAARLGEWPLLLKLVNGVLRDRIARAGDSVDGATAYAGKVLDRRGLTGFDARDAQQRHRAVAGTLDASLERLTDAERGRVRDLAVFDEDVDVPIATVELLWEATAGLDDLATEELLQRLAGLSLLEHFDLATRQLRLHDVVRSYLRGPMSAAELAALHRAIVAGYRRRCPRGWASGPDDGYFFQHLPAHLAAAGTPDELRALLLDLVWLEARLDVAGVSGVLEDYAAHAADPDTSRLGRVLRLSAHVLARDPGALLPQLLGRIDAEDAPELRARVEAHAERHTAAPWLRPRRATLRPPGDALLQTLVGHRDRVTSVALTPDGASVVSGSDDATLKLWDLASGEELGTLAGHAEYVLGIAVTPDGTRAVSGSADATVRVWDLATRREVDMLQGHIAAVRSVAVSADGTRLVSGSDDCLLKVWDLARGTQLATLGGHRAGIMTVAVTADGRRAVTGSGDRTVKVWDLDRAVEVATLTGHDQGIVGTTVTPDGVHAVSGSMDGMLKVWHLPSAREVTTLPGHRARVWSVAPTPDGRHLVSGSADRTIRVWDLASGSQVAVLTGHRESIRAVVVTPDGARVVSGSNDRTIRVWTLASTQSHDARTAHAPAVETVAVTPDGTRIVAGSFDGSLALWDAATGQRVAALGDHRDVVACVGLTPDGARAVSGSWDKTLKVWDLSTGRLLATLDTRQDEIASVALSGDGRRVVSGSWDGSVKVWDLTSGRELGTFAAHRAEVSSVAVTPDGTRIVSGSRDATLKIFDLATGRECAALTGHRAAISAVVVTPDGSRVLSASMDRTVKIWSLASGKEIATLAGHDGRVTTLAVTVDGTRAVTGSDDSTVRVWALRDGGPVATFHTDATVRAVASWGAGLVVAGCADGAVHVLDLRM